VILLNKLHKQYKYQETR